MGDGLTEDHFYDVGDGLTPHLCFIISRPSHVGDCPMRSCSGLMPHSSDVANQSIQHCSDVGDGAIPHSLLKPHIDLDHAHGHGHDHDDGLVEHSDNSSHESSRSFFPDACHKNTDLALLCPRISFSLEGVISKQEEEHHYLAGINARVCEEEESREWRDSDKSEDFEFSNNHEALGYSDLGGSSSSSSQSCSSNRLSMLPADELFSNGKLIPLGSHQRTWSLPSSSATSSFLSQNLHESHANMKAKPQERASLARHLSLDMSKHSCSLPSSSSSSSLSSKKGFKLSPSVENSPCSSPQRLLLGPSQYSPNIIMHFVKPNLASEKTTFASSKSWRMPIHTPRSFWPFSRSNSSRLIDKKIKCIMHSTPPRSIVRSSSPPCNNNNIRWTPKKIYTTSEEENMMPWEGPRIRRGVEKKVCREGLRAKRLYPITVSPVLNMAIFRGTTSKCRVFRLGKFFSWRKDNKSAKEKPCIC